jgi:hypothetical protein
VQAGATRTDSPYAWPPSLLRPCADVRLVYLDLNHWICLARAASRHPEGRRHRDALEALRSARASGDVLFPLSGLHYMEMSGIRDPRQRRDVAGVMEELSDFRTLLSHPSVMRLEIEAALDHYACPNPTPYPPVPILGTGLGHAFGRRGGLRIASEDGEDVTEQARHDWPGGPSAFDEWKVFVDLEFERRLLRGPEDDDVSELEHLGWDPLVARRGAERRAEQEREQAARFAEDPHWRRGRIRDVISARYAAFEIFDMLIEALAERDLQLPSVWSDPDAARRFVDSMPSGDVWVSLVTAAHRNPMTVWKPNDIFDIDALSLAVAYCDVVATEKHFTHVLDASGAPSRLNTPVVKTLSELVELL